jgi:hypothetical protein
MRLDQRPLLIGQIRGQRDFPSSTSPATSPMNQAASLESQMTQPIQNVPGLTLSPEVRRSHSCT